MPTIQPLAIYDELLDLFSDCGDLDQLLSYRLPADKQERLDELLEKNREGTLTVDDRLELSAFVRLEHLGRMLKARLRQKLK